MRNRSTEQYHEYASHQCGTIETWLADKSLAKEVRLEPERFLESVRVRQKLFWRS